MIHTGDCLDVMATLDAESVDAIVTDPPYGLEFMGMAWDRLGEVVRGSNPAMKRHSTDMPTPGANGGVSYGAHAKMPRCRKCGKYKVGNEKPGKGGVRCKCPVPDFDYRQAESGFQMQAAHHRWATEALRVAKPGAYLLAFGGTRTVHRLTVALEDAGWVIRDLLVWAYAQGFPKSRSSLKPAWEPIVLARKPGPLRMLAIDSCRIGFAGDADEAEAKGKNQHTRYANPGSNRDSYSGNMPERTDYAAPGRWPSNLILTDPIFDGNVPGVVGGGEAGGGYGVRGRGGDVYGGGNGYTTDMPVTGQTVGYGDSGTYSRFFLVPKADRSDREPVLDEYAYRLHRERGECDKLRAWASADLSLVEPTASTSPARATSDELPTAAGTSSSGTSLPGSPPTDPSPTATRSTTSTGTRPTTGSPTSFSSIPSPTSASTPAANSATASGGSPVESAASESLWAPPTGISVPRAGRSTGDADRATSGSSSSRSVCGRCGKPLPRVGSHPTVKPTELMRHLVRLVTPPGGVVLDPFLGSGTTALACEAEGFEWIGIEREPEYVAIAEARLNGQQRGLGLVG